MIRKAKIADIKKIRLLINHYAEKGVMLNRSLNEIYENMRDYFVAVERSKVTGCCAAHISWNDLAEIKSLAVEDGKWGKGTGKKLVDTCLKEVKEMGVSRVFVLTYIPDFFKNMGFKVISKDELPHKIWNECINCPKFPDCDEVALMKKI